MPGGGHEACHRLFHGAEPVFLVFIRQDMKLHTLGYAVFLRHKAGSQHHYFSLDKLLGIMYKLVVATKTTIRSTDCDTDRMPDENRAYPP